MTVIIGDNDLTTSTLGGRLVSPEQKLYSQIRVYCTLLPGFSRKRLMTSSRSELGSFWLLLQVVPKLWQRYFCTKTPTREDLIPLLPGISNDETLGFNCSA